MSYAHQSIAVLGAGESGESAARLLHQENAMVTILDTAEENKLRKKIEALGAEGIRVIAGLAAEHESTHSRYDAVILSPGIDPAVPLVQNFIKRRIEMIGELELAYEMCKCPIIGITGTNGKTTTTQLVEKMLNACGVKTVACGNIGPAFSAKVRESARLDVMTVEISSFQLETVRRFHCQTSVWLGFAPDHLDRYHSMEEYYAAKIRIFENQTADDWAIVNYRDKLPPLQAQKITFSAYVSDGDFDLRNGVIHFRGVPVLAMAETNLRGSHNAENLMATLGVGFVRGLSFAQMVPPLREYKPLPHRCEILRTVNGVEWVNDSKGTNPDSVEKALHSETRRVVLIAGGKDKGFEYDLLTDLVAARCRAVVVMGEMADRIEAIWKARLPVSNAGRSLEKAVELAHSLAQPGDVVLFSPGTSSFDMFKNYADRGNQFRALVQALPA
ncbi:MAG: UDP-N-acetylmuramoyl-L-alanine--D-glutamate ligase [Chthoniobacter sp.]|uniref:UDP-N-acetylmuramoyl-L-alanine--D-glutamate ligase n=1 Tax=Chthoniobacter sp. TaxID=2510640 RepID=UPI0032A63862